MNNCDCIAIFDPTVGQNVISYCSKHVAVDDLLKALNKIADYPMIFSLMPQIIGEIQYIAKEAILSVEKKNES